MTAPHPRFPTLAAGLLLLVSQTVAAQPPADQYGVPLPEHARLRLGNLRMRDPSGWSGAVLSIDGKYLHAHLPLGFSRIDVTSGGLTGQPLKVPTGVAGGGQTELSADGKRAVTLVFGAVVVWDTGSGATTTKVERRNLYGVYGAAALSADGKTLAVGGAKDDKEKDKPITALVWDVEKNEKRAEVTVLQNQSASVALSADGKLLATCGYHSEPVPPGGRADPTKDLSRVVQFWDATSGKELARTRLDGYDSPRVVFAPDGTTAAVATPKGVVRLVDPRTGTVLRQLFGQAGIGERVAFSPDGKLLAAANSEGTVQLWQTADGGLTATTPCPVSMASGLREVRFTGNDRAVVWATLGPTAVVWEVPSGKLLSVIGGHTGAVTGVAFAAGGKEVLTGGDDGLILRWDAATGKQLGPIPLRIPGGGLVLTPGAIEFVNTASGPVVVVNQGPRRGRFDLATGAQVVSTPESFGYRSLLAADARTVVTVPSLPYDQDPPKTITLTAWDTATGAKLVEADVPAGELVAVSVSPDRTKLVTALNTRTAGKESRLVLLITGWDLTTGGKKLGELTEKGGYGTVFVTAAPDNVTALVSTTDDRLVVVDVTTGKAVREIETGRSRVTCAPVFGPDAKTFAVGVGGGYGAGGTARVYDASGKPIRTFRGHLGLVLSVAFSPDGTTLASGSSDTTALIWSLPRPGE
jgi:WD40 repeat protein